MPSFQESVTLTFIFGSIGVILGVTALGVAVVMMIKKSKLKKEDV